MSSGFKFYVFLAHNSLDIPQVRKISAKLRERGLKPWLDEEQIPPGKAFQDEIQKAIPQIKSAVIIIGSQGLGNWQKLELKTLISQFVNRNTPVIPVLLVGVNQIPDDLYFLKEFHWVNFEQEDDNRAFDNLEWEITVVKPTANTKTVTLTAEEWFNSGYNKGKLGDKQGAISDYNQAAQLYSQQNKMDDYLDALEQVKKLENR